MTTDPPATTLPPDSPRLALLRPLNTPPYHLAATALRASARVSPSSPPTSSTT